MSYTVQYSTVVVLECSDASSTGMLRRKPYCQLYLRITVPVVRTGTVHTVLYGCTWYTVDIGSYDMYMYDVVSISPRTYVLYSTQVPYTNLLPICTVYTVL